MEEVADRCADARRVDASDPGKIRDQEEHHEERPIEMVRPVHEERALRAVLAGMLREADRSGPGRR
jgi:hypothetical protein